MSRSVEIANYTHEELKDIFDQYRNELEGNIFNVSNIPHIRNTLVEDIKPNLLLKDKKFKVAVLDVGGSYFKISMVNIRNKNGVLSCEIKSIQNFPYPVIKEKPFWFDWVSEKYVNYIFDNQIRPDFCSLIFSYPIKYEGSIARPVALAKHWCFEYEKTLGSDLKKDLNNAIMRLLKNRLRPRVYQKYKFKYLVYSVLNDSVATFFSSKILIDGVSIGIILGTGTNGAFIIQNEGRDFVYNTEWGSFIPENINLLTEERDYIQNLTVNYNLLDILVGNGYKCALLKQILKTRNIKVLENDINCVGEIMKRSDEDIEKLIVKGLIRRSRQIMSMMVCASLDKIQSKHVTILLNGSGYSDTVEREAFLKMIRRYAEEACNLNVEIDMHYEEGLTFIGAAYYAYAVFSNKLSL